MSRHVLPHVWTVHPHSPKWEWIAGAKPDCMVRTAPLPKGFLWVHGKQHGYSPSAEEARGYAEAAREIWPKLV
jgi:hypothetical protein